MRQVITSERLRSLLDYNQGTGVFTWNSKPSKNICVGSSAGSVNGLGYVILGIDGQRLLAHRLAFLHVTGHWPEHCVDHINGIKSDNRWGNLRDVPRVVNQQNLRKAPINSKSGLIGAFPAKDSKQNPWQSSIRIKGERAHLGYFQTKELAHAAYLEAKRQHHEGCTI